ncbi:MAG TPA: hypothetical protein VL261_12710 [Nitrospira sp.]|nr:hypothetical protein [Nitrospira sp.]
MKMMIHGLSQYVGCVQRRLFLVILAFLSLPYLVDLAFLGDLTPTHYAQENTNNAREEIDLLDGTASLPHVTEHVPSETAAITVRDLGMARRAAVPAIFYLEHLFSAYHPFRPPPSV